MAANVPIIGLLALVILSGALAAENDSKPERVGRKLQQLSDEIADFSDRYRPDRFCANDWRLVENRLRELGRRTGGRGHKFVAAVEDFEGTSAEIRTRCLAAAKSRTETKLAELRDKAAAVEDGLKRGALRETAALRELLEACETVAGRLGRLEAARLAEDYERAESVLERLLREAPDPCDEDFRVAWQQHDRGRLREAEAIYESILEGPCLLEQSIEEADWALRLLRSAEEPRLANKQRVPPGASSDGGRFRNRAEVPAASERPAAAVQEPEASNRADPTPVGGAAQAREAGTEDLGSPPSDFGSRERALIARTPSAGARRLSAEVPELAMTLWQSAWGDFTDLETLGDFIERNHIAEVYLNPGLAITEKNFAEARDRLKHITDRLRSYSGLRRVHFLYAELNYDIGTYAEFLRRYQDELEIDTLADDSEFTDLFRHRFERNNEVVTGHKLNYAAFVTLETEGNSGVSDETRRWALKHVDQPILMSYFSCDLEGQKKWLEDYLDYADSEGRSRDVRIAILLGTKKVGREVSCERELGPAEFQKLLKELHAWATEHVSYRGLVLENNRRLPRYDVAPRATP